MTEPCICAVDPGLTGAVAFYFPSLPDRVTVEDLPVIAGRVDVHALSRRLAQMGPTLAVIEAVNAMPSIGAGGQRRTMGASSAFNFGRGVGEVETVLTLAGVPLHRFVPAAWKKYWKIPGKAAGGEDIARREAIRLFPASADRFARKKDHGRADAALIAAYAADKLLRGGAE